MVSVLGWKADFYYCCCWWLFFSFSVLCIACHWMTCVISFKMRKKKVQQQNERKENTILYIPCTCNMIYNQTDIWFSVFSLFGCCKLIGFFFLSKSAHYTQLWCPSILIVLKNPNKTNKINKWKMFCDSAHLVAFVNRFQWVWMSMQKKINKQTYNRKNDYHCYFSL